ncbi:MAG: protein adenylyltransferase SelO [Enterobacteriaceae bacterium]
MPQFDNTFCRQLAGFYSSQMPTPLQQASLFYYNAPLAAELELNDTLFQEPEAGVFSGAKLLPGMQPIAQVYSGHQFGVWAGQLGDGRAILLGEQRLSDGRKFDWHLKGGGQTPFSRMGDGRCVLRSVIREFLASEALHGLGIATTRALTVVTSRHPVRREQPERGAMLLRIAESHVRFGHFEHFYYRQQPEQVRQLADYVIEHHWPQWQQEEQRYQWWFTDVVRRTAKMIAGWQCYGFAHGVMNTDNMSILGLTLDYGPYGFLDQYQPHFICNHSDHQGRYAFDYQPGIAYWNLQRLAQSLRPLLSDEQLQQGLMAYQDELMKVFSEMIRARLGLYDAQEGDSALLTGLQDLMSAEQQDYNQTFRLLCEVEQGSPQCRLRDQFIDRPGFDHWLSQYRQRLQRQGLDETERQRRMRRVNPHTILRNYLAQMVIEQAEKDQVTLLGQLHQALQNPFDPQTEDPQFSALPPEWSKTLVLSCSS